MVLWFSSEGESKSGDPCCGFEPLSAGTTEQGATLKRGGEPCPLACTTFPAPWRTSGQKRGGAPSTISPSRAARSHGGKGPDPLTGKRLHHLDAPPSPCTPDTL